MMFVSNAGETTLNDVMQQMSDSQSWFLDYMGVDDAVEKYSNTLFLEESFYVLILNFRTL
jgi:hypothetical protein